MKIYDSSGKATTYFKGAMKSKFSHSDFKKLNLSSPINGKVIVISILRGVRCALQLLLIRTHFAA